MGYVGILKSALVIFPFVALALSLPIFVYQYNKYGAFIFWRAVVIYSFIFYLIAAYFLTILPLPSIETVAKLTTPKYNLVPFMFVREFVKETPLIITEPSTYLKTITNASFIQPFFNLMLTLPFGVYLRYYFKKSWRQVVLFGFLLSLFFELTQLSGLYGIYPRPYRLFDVDDLMLNTTGALLGYAVAPLITRFFPTESEMAHREQIDRTKVSYPRRFTAWMIDFIIFMTLLVFGSQYLDFWVTYAVLVVGYMILLPMFWNGQTVGKKLVRIRIVNDHQQILSKKRLVWRQFQLWFMIIPGIFGGAIYFLNKTGQVDQKHLQATFVLASMFLGLVIIYLLSILVAWIFKTRLVYEKFAKTQEIAVLKEEKHEK